MLHKGNSQEDFIVLNVLSWLGGFVLAVFLFSTCLALTSPDEFRKILIDWQPLIVGLLAFVGALITVFAISKQINLAQAQEDERRQRRHFADRAALPLALVELGDYLDSCVNALKAYNPCGNEHLLIRQDDGWVPPSLPHLPSTAVTTLRSCIETAKPSEMRILYLLIARLQIQNSRFNSFFEGIKSHSSLTVTTYHMNRRIIESAHLGVVCSDLFDYARLRKEQILEDVSVESVEMRLFNLRVLNEEFPRLYEALKEDHGLISL